MSVENQVYFFIIHDESVYNTETRWVDLDKCKQYIDEIVSGKRKTFDVFFGKGTFRGLGSHQNEYIINLEEILYSTQNRIYSIGSSLQLYSGWIELGTYARKRLLAINPSSRRNLIWETYENTK